MKPNIKKTYSFKGYGGSEAICGLEVYKKGDKGLAFITELPENKGTSITNAVEIIVCKLFLDFGLRPEHTIYIEHYPAEYYRNSGENEQDTFDLVKIKSIKEFDNFLSKENYFKVFANYLKVNGWERLEENKEKIVEKYF